MTEQIRTITSDTDETGKRAYAYRNPREHVQRSQGSNDAIVIDLRENPTIGIDGEDHRVFLHHRPGILSAPQWKLASKRLVDVTAGLALLTIFLPIILITALSVKLTSQGPILYLQDRVGKDGRIFRFAKFRSMYNGAHDDRYLVENQNDVDGPVFKIKDDPRTTLVGRFIRRYSIDELPQLIHVVAGTMSLVGPRPPIPEEVAKYGAWERQRLLTKPGITCIWQVSGRSEIDFETWIKMDIEYISTWTPWLDIRILAKTIPAVISGRGAY